jgi:hypothetical protein
VCGKCRECGVIHSEPNLLSSNERSERMEAMASFKLWICLATIGCAGTVSTLSIQAGPSASNAIVAIRVAHLELFWAKNAFRDPAVHESEHHLNEAWSMLRDRQYDQSILAASEALQRVRDIKGGVPWFYSSHRDGRKSESGNSPES